MHADTKVLKSGLMKHVERETRVSLNVGAANEIRWHDTRMGHEILGDGFEPRILPRPQRSYAPSSRRGETDGTISEIDGLGG